MSFPLRWKNTLAVPIVALLLVVALGMLLIGYVINNRVFDSAIEEREKDKVNSILFATRAILDAEVRKLSAVSNLLMTDDSLSAAMAHHQRTEGDTRPLKAAMDDLFPKIDTQTFVVTDTDGVVLYRANEPLRRGDSQRIWGFEEAVSGSRVINSSEGPNGWAIRALAPIRSGSRVVGVLILGTPINDQLAGRISRETGARILFANQNGVLTGSAPREEKIPYDLEVIREVLLRSYPIFRMDTGGYRAIQYTPLKVVDETFCLIIETDMAVVRGMLHRNREKLFEAGAVILVGVLLLGTLVTLWLVRPLKTLQREAQEVVREFTGHDLPPEAGENEIRTLSSAIHRMVEAIREHIRGREAAEAALRQSEEQLRQSQKMEAVGRLAGGIAHDFNNLLTVINGYSDVLLRRLGESDPGRWEVGEIHKAGERAAALTRQLLAFSRKQVLEPKPVRLNEIVTGMSVMLRRLLGENVVLATALEPKAWTALADPGQVEQVVLNLAVNARDAMPAGGTITISTSNVALLSPDDRDGFVIPAGRYVRLGVTDTGCGMDAKTMEHMFDPFFTTKERGKGTGLGLASVYGIVKQSGGLIRARSAPGRGSSFEVYFPMALATDDRGAVVDEPVAGHTEQVLKGENILIVEDEEPVRRLMVEWLREGGYSIIAAGDAQEALSLLERHSRPIDLLLTDLMMPGMDGMELARRLMPLHPAMKVLLISGYTEVEIDKFIRKEPGTAFLQKPYTPSVLSRKVREVLDAPSVPPHPPAPVG